MRAPRTHVVDLGGMPREELIDIAKRQASQIREKNQRLSAMEAFIESFTGAPVEESLPDSHAYPRILPNNARATAPVLSTSPSATPTVATVPASQLSELQQTLEEEQLQHTLRVSQLEEQLRERRREYEQLQAKVDAWKEEVMAIMTTDQERIRSLEAQLDGVAASSHGPLLSPYVLPGAPPRDATVPSVDAEEHHSTALYQQRESGVSAFREELPTVTEGHQRAQSQPQRPLPAATATLILEKSSTTASPAVLSPQPSPPPAALSGDTLSRSPGQMTASDIPEDVLQEAVQAQLGSWKVQADSEALAHKGRIEELEAQLAALREVTDAGEASRDCLLAEAEALRAEVSRLQVGLQTAQRERETLEESTGSQMEMCRAACEDKIAELKLEMNRLRAAVDAAQVERDAAVSVSTAEYVREAGSLRADINRLREELCTVAEERDNATVTLRAFREKMNEWKAKVRGVVEDGEAQRRALEAEVRFLKEQQLAAAAVAAAEVVVEHAATQTEKSQGMTANALDTCAVFTKGKEECTQTDVVAGELTNDLTESLVAAVRDVAVQTTLTTEEAPLGAEIVTSSGQSPTVPLPRHRCKVEDFSEECKSLEAENARLHRALAQLSNFRAEVMHEVRAAATDFVFSPVSLHGVYSGSV